MIPYTVRAVFTRQQRSCLLRAVHVAQNQLVGEIERLAELDIKLYEGELGAKRTELQCLHDCAAALWLAVVD